MKNDSSNIEHIPEAAHKIIVSVDNALEVTLGEVILKGYLTAVRSKAEHWHELVIIA